MKKVAAHQPNYLPNMGFFYKMSLVDDFIIISNVQFEKNEGWQQRHKIKGGHGDVWLTVPVFGTQNQLIKDVEINNSISWKRKHKKTLQHTYGKTNEQKFLDDLLAVYDKDHKRLVDLNFELISLLKDALGIRTNVILDEEVGGGKEDLLVNICKKYSADCYLSGMGAKDYMTESYFKALDKGGVEHEFIEKNKTGAYPYSIVHYILTLGIDETKKLLI